jgi:REP element-mobilizing transposase RayT
MQNVVFHPTAANFEHRAIIGKSVRRMGEFEYDLMMALAASNDRCMAWCVLPNHYHLLAVVTDLNRTVKCLGQLYGQTSRRWNLEDNRTGRQCWYRCADRAIRSEEAHVGDNELCPPQRREAWLREELAGMAFLKRCQFSPKRGARQSGSNLAGPPGSGLRERLG